MSQRRVVEELLRYGKRLNNSPSSYTGAPRSPEEKFILLDPNAWLMGVIFDQSQDYKRAWKGPYRLKRRLGSATST